MNAGRASARPHRIALAAALLLIAGGSADAGAGILVAPQAVPAAAGAGAATPDAADASPRTSSNRCTDAGNTLEIIRCQGRELAGLNSQLRRYLAAAQQRERQLAREDGRRAANLQEGQRAWEAYRLAACTEVYQHWGNGSIRGPMTMACQLDLTRERLQRIWSDFLTLPDGSPPLLPEPSREGAP